MQIRTPVDAKIVLQEAARRFRPKKERFQVKRSWRFLSALHLMQKALLECKGQRLAALCSRRAGKTFLAAAMLLQAAGDHPESLCAYLATTREQARRNMWRELKRFDRLYALGLDFNNTRMVCTLKNGSEIICLGALNEKDVDRLRGAAFVLVVIDEAASFPVRQVTRRHDAPSRRKKREEDAEGTLGPVVEKDAQEDAVDERSKQEGDMLYRLWREILQPAMLDYQGKVLMIGTPAAHCSGFFFDITHPNKEKRRKGWDVFQWTVEENPHVPKVKTKEIPDVKTWLKMMRAEQGYHEEDPEYQREWLGRWIRSADSLVYYGFSEKRNVYGTPLVGEDGAPLPLGRRGRHDWLAGGLDHLLSEIPAPKKRLSPAEQRMLARAVGGGGEAARRAAQRIQEDKAAAARKLGRVQWFFGVSVDLGYDDPTVIGLFAWNLVDPTVYLIAVKKRKKMIPSAIAGEIKRAMKLCGALTFVVVDQGGGAGKMIAEEFKERWGIPAKGAEKPKKATFIELCNGDFETGRFKIHARCEPVLDEISVLQWDPRFLGRKEDPRFGNDACDMMLYGWREAKHHGHTGDEEPAELVPDEGTPEHAERERARNEEEAVRRWRMRKSGDPGDPFDAGASSSSWGAPVDDDWAKP